jgi:hypothetical protein
MPRVTCCLPRYHLQLYPVTCGALACALLQPCLVMRHAASVAAFEQAYINAPRRSILTTTTTPSASNITALIKQIEVERSLVSDNQVVAQRSVCTGIFISTAN